MHVFTKLTNFTFIINSQQLGPVFRIFQYLTKNLALMSLEWGLLVITIEFETGYLSKFIVYLMRLFEGKVVPQKSFTNETSGLLICYLNNHQFVADCMHEFYNVLGFGQLVGVIYICA